MSPSVPRYSYPLLALVTVALGLALLTPAAKAGTYDVRVCTEGVTEPGAIGPFERSGNQTVYSLSNACGAANGLRIGHIAGSPGTNDAAGNWIATLPDGITATQVSFKARGSGSGGYRPRVIGSTGGPLAVLKGDGALQGDFTPFTLAGDYRRLGVQMLCVSDSTCAASPPSAPDAALKDVTYSLTDPTPPTVGAQGGSLLAGLIQSGAQSLDFAATDAGSGVARTFARVNGVEAGAAPGSCVAGALRPCSVSQSGSLSLNTAAAPWINGFNVVEVCAEDFSGEIGCAPVGKVRALNGCATNPVAPASGGQTLQLEWPGKRTAATRVRQGRARSATATVHGPAGAPVAGALVCFSRSIPDGGPQERLVEAAAITGPDGRATVKIRGASSRDVHATYWIDGETAITKTIALEVSPRIRLGLRPDRRAVKVGRDLVAVAVLRGKWKEDARVCFYVKRPGRDKAGCDQTGEGGRARYAYDVSEEGKLAVYAKVPNQRDFPFTRGRSAVKVKRAVR